MRIERVIRTCFFAALLASGACGSSKAKPSQDAATADVHVAFDAPVASDAADLTAADASDMSVADAQPDQVLLPPGFLFGAAIDSWQGEGDYCPGGMTFPSNWADWE